MASKTIEIGKDNKQLLVDLYGVSLDSKNPYASYFNKKDGVAITYYTSGKLLFQGENAEKEATRFCKKYGIKYEDSNNFGSTDNYKSYIGSDETGTGSFFGGIVTSAVYIPKNSYQDVINLGVMDSKKMTDSKIMRIYHELTKKVIYSSYLMYPKKYNQLNKDHNMNVIKTMAHVYVLNSVARKLEDEGGTFDGFVVDEYCKDTLFDKYVRSFEGQNLKEKYHKPLRFEMKGESKALSIACASVIARYNFLEHIEELRTLTGLEELPQGANDHVIEIGKQIKDEKGQANLLSLCKNNFKTLEKII